jgi:hypothetical protein
VSLDEGAGVCDAVPDPAGPPPALAAADGSAAAETEGAFDVLAEQAVMTRTPARSDAAERVTRGWSATPLLLYMADRRRG